MNVLSLFDGISCGQVALSRAGVNVKNYFASEVDEAAIKITRHNFPRTIFLGDVTKLCLSELPKIDLLIGGSPCQGFSRAGLSRGARARSGVSVTSLRRYLDLKRKGAAFHSQSYLFWEFVNVLESLRKRAQPIKFLLENVPMKQEWVRMINTTLMCEAVEFNSDRVSAQNRPRLYWTNITGFAPEIPHKNLVLGDILDRSMPEKYDITERYYKKFYGTTTYVKSRKNCRGLDQLARCLTASGQNIANSGATNIFIHKDHIRRLSPLECERLQTLPEGYTDVPGVSEAARYSSIGNGWTVDVIAHIFKGLNPSGGSRRKRSIKEGK